MQGIIYYWFTDECEQLLKIILQGFMIVKRFQLVLTYIEN